MIDLIFSGVNFAILVGLAAYAYMTYALPSIRAAIQHDQVEQDRLIAQRTQLRQSCRSVEDTVQQQEQQYHDLQDKMMAWERVVEDVQRKRKEEQRAIIKNVRKHRYQQRMYSKQRALFNHCVPQAFDQAREQLRSQYHGQAGKDYINNILKQMEQRNG